MSIGTQVGLYFYEYLGQLTNIAIGQYFLKFFFACLVGLGPKSRPFLIYQPTVPQLV